MTAQAAQGVLDNVIDMQGVAEAKSVYKQNGEIVIAGEGDETVNVGGKLNVSGKHHHQTGGTVEITGNDINLDSTAIIDASGDAGGGHIQIGRDDAGNLSQTTTIANGASLLANTNSGNGGLIETSGEQLILGQIINVNTLSGSGTNGTWVIRHPTNIYIALDQTNATAAGMAGMDASADSGGTGTNPETFTASGAVPSSLLTTGTLEDALLYERAV